MMTQKEPTNLPTIAITQMQDAGIQRTKSINDGEVQPQGHQRHEWERTITRESMI